MTKDAVAKEWDLPIVGGRRYSDPADAPGLVDQGFAIITGSGFPDFSALLIDTLKDDIEAADAGTALYNMTGVAARGWGNCDGIEGGSVITAVRTAAAAFGTKGLECAVSGGSGQFGVVFDTGAEIDDLLVLDYAWIDSDGNGQWKQYRTCSENCLTDDALTNTLLNWFSNSFDAFMVQKGGGCGGGGSIDTLYQHNFSGGVPIEFDTWYRREFRYVPGDPNTANGRMEYRVIRASDGVEIFSVTRTDVISYDTGETNRDRYVVLQNYQGNGFEAATTVVRMDDTRIQVGGQQRVYLTDGTRRQPVTVDVANSSSTQIRFKVYQGMLSTLEGATAIVVDGSGNETEHTPAGDN
jgi:hypothetical protein